VSIIGNCTDILQYFVTILLQYKYQIQLKSVFKMSSCVLEFEDVNPTA